MKLPFKKFLIMLKDKNSQDILRKIFTDTLTSTSLIIFLATPALYFKNAPTFIWYSILTLSLLSQLFVLFWAIYTLNPLFEELLQRDTKMNRFYFACWVALVELGITYSIWKLFMPAFSN